MLRFLCRRYTDIKFRGACDSHKSHAPLSKTVCFLTVLILFPQAAAPNGRFCADIRRPPQSLTNLPDPKSSYRKIYLHTNSTARTYISGVIFFALPHTRLITT